MFDYKLTAELSWYEPGMGKGTAVYGGDFGLDRTAEYFSAPSDEEALRIAESLIPKTRHFRWTKWQADKTGYERNRTAMDYNYSWMRVERTQRSIS